MAYATGTYTWKPEAPGFKGRPEPVACDCWFTSGGRIIPRFIKYKDEEGIVHGIYNIQVMSQKEKKYCGIASTQYLCRTVWEEKEYFFHLTFRKEECTWYVVWL